MQKNRDWAKLDDESLEGLLVERWVLRGVILAVMFAAAIASTYLGTRGITTFADGVTLVALLASALVAGIVAFSMRATDLRMHRELRRRRHPA
ncbi:MAG: hypothetical protein HYV04_03605 [Deltaproteobacteria bacterium]|nr:hypothetical protein [Deltaproteobacteria bacterium]